MSQEELEHHPLAMLILYLQYLLWLAFTPITVVLPFVFANLIMPWWDFPHWLFCELPAGFLMVLRTFRYTIHRASAYMPAEHGAIQDHRRWWLGGAKRQALYTILVIFASVELVQFWLWFIGSGFFCPTICPGAYMGDGVTAPLYPFNEDVEHYNQAAWYSPTYNGSLPSAGDDSLLQAEGDPADWPILEGDGLVPWASATPDLWPTNPDLAQPTAASSRPVGSFESWKQEVAGDAAAASPLPAAQAHPVVTSLSAYPLPTETWSGGLDPEMFTDVEIMGPQVVVDPASSTTPPPNYLPTMMQPEDDTAGVPATAEQFSTQDMNMYLDDLDNAASAYPAYTAIDKIPPSSWAGPPTTMLTKVRYKAA